MVVRGSNPILRRLRQEELKFKAILGHAVILSPAARSDFESSLHYARSKNKIDIGSHVKVKAGLLFSLKSFFP